VHASKESYYENLGGEDSFLPLRERNSKYFFLPWREGVRGRGTLYKEGV